MAHDYELSEVGNCGGNKVVKPGGTSPMRLAGLIEKSARRRY
jgi:hypothetical protein